MSPMLSTYGSNALSTIIRDISFEDTGKRQFEGCPKTTENTRGGKGRSTLRLGGNRQILL